MPKKESDLVKIGGLWANTSKGGTRYMNGTIELDGKETKVVIFKNTFKKDGENTPDYRVYVSTGDGAASKDNDLPF